MIAKAVVQGVQAIAQQGQAAMEPQVSHAGVLRQEKDWSTISHEMRWGCYHGDDPFTVG